MEFAVVYGKEPHPGEPAYRKYGQPQTFEQRRVYAQDLAETYHMATTVMVDTMENEALKLFGALPNMVYVIARDGTIAYKATWTRSNKIDQVLRALTAEESAPAQLS